MIGMGPSSIVLSSRGRLVSLFEARGGLPRGALRFSSVDEARAFLLGFSRSREELVELRRLLARVGGSGRRLPDDGRVLVEIAAHLVRGSILAVERDKPLRLGGDAILAPEEEAPLPAAVAAPAPIVAPEEAPALADELGVDQAAQAAVLVRAAEDGTPFCRECAAAS